MFLDLGFCVGDALGVGVGVGVDAEEELEGAGESGVPVIVFDAVPSPAAFTA